MEDFTKREEPVIQDPAQTHTQPTTLYSSVTPDPANERPQLVPLPTSVGSGPSPKKPTFTSRVATLLRRRAFLVTAIVAVLAIGGGAYVFISNHSHTAVAHLDASTLINGAKLVSDSHTATQQAVSLPNVPSATNISADTITTALPKLASSTPVYMSSGAQAPPTNQWYSSLAFYHDHNMAIFAHPYKLNTSDNGFILGAERVTPTPNTIFDSASSDIKVDFAKSTWNFVNYYDDMMVKTDFKNNDEVQGTLTLTHGSPYAFVTLPSSGKVSVSGDAMTNYKSNAYTFATNGTKYLVTWSTTGVTANAGSNSIAFTATGTDNLISIATVPIGTSVDSIYADALNQITQTTVSAVRNGSTWETSFSAATKNGQPTIFGFLPNENAGIHDAGSSVGSIATLYGKQSFYSGNRFTSTSTVTIPASTYDASSFTAAQKTALIPLVKADIASLSFTAPDTYFDGKALAKGAQLYDLAKQLGLSTEATVAHDKVTAEFADWFKTGDCNTKSLHCFIYDPNLRGVVGKQFAFGDQDMNDHHFHYGYFLAAGALMAKYDSTFIGTYGPYLDMLARDYANTDRSDTTAPYIRNYDLYVGHSWAAGLSPFGDGNNNESSSEAANAYYGLYQWASASGNSTLASTGLWLYDRESTSALNYWVNLDKSQFPGFTAPFVSMVWGGKRDYATWFSAAGEAKLAIQVLPLTPASLYLNRDKARVASNLQAAAPSPSQYKDILVGYRALTDPTGAQTAADALAASDIDDGNTKANLQAFIDYSQSPSSASKAPLTSATCSTKINGASAATYSVSAATAGTYRIWLRIAGDTASPSVAVKVDDGCPSIVSTSTSAYTWVGDANGVANTLSLSAGSHTVTVAGMTAGSRVDQVVLLSDLLCIPSGTSTTCSSNGTTTVPPTTTPPVTGSTGDTTTTPPTTTVPPITTTTPSAPTTTPSVSNLHVANTTPDSITLAWDGSLTDTYDVLRSGVKIGSIQGTTFKDSGLVKNTPYVYSVRLGSTTTPQITSYTSGSTTPTSTTTTSPATTSSTSTTTTPTTTPQGPSNLHVLTKTGNTITIAWDGPLSLSYDILRSGVKIATVENSQFTDNGLISNTPYIYSVRGNNITTPQITAYTQ